MKPFTRKCTVYCLMNIVTQDKYVGSTTNYSGRKRHHLSNLKLGKHRSEKLQKAYNSYGENAFMFFKLEEFETHDWDFMIQREQVWIDQYKPEYNMNLVAGNYFNENARSTESKKKSVDKRKGRKQSEEERAMRSKTQLERYKDPHEREKQKWTPEQRQKTIDSMTGEKNHNWGKKRTQGFKDMIGDMFSSMQFRYTSPSGEEVTFRNLTKFCKDNALPYHMMRALHQGKKKEYKGWTFKNKVFVGYNKDKQT